jgi:hypothetical protein
LAVTVIHTPKRRIERDDEAQTATDRVRANPTRANFAALHRVHADHLREDGEHASAAQADARAEHLENTEHHH